MSRLQLPKTLRVLFWTFLVQQAAWLLYDLTRFSEKGWVVLIWLAIGSFECWLLAACLESAERPVRFGMWWFRVWGVMGLIAIPVTLTRPGRPLWVQVDYVYFAVIQTVIGFWLAALVKKRDRSAQVRSVEAL